MNCCVCLVYLLNCGRPRARTISDFEQTEAIDDREKSEETGCWAACERFRKSIWWKVILFILILLKAIAYSIAHQNSQDDMMKEQSEIMNRMTIDESKIISR